MTCQAEIEYHKCKRCIAFNVSSAIFRRKLNQYATKYLFKDGSRLDVYDAPNRRIEYRHTAEEQPVASSVWGW